jgi:hypothetical protein
VIAKSIVKNTDPSSALHQQMAQRLESPDELQIYEGSLDSARFADFDSLRARGDAIGVRWRDVQFQRFELERLRNTRDTLWEKVAPLRFLGYVFLRDPLSNKSYGFTVGDMMQIDGKWYGGTLSRVFEAGSKFEFDQHLAAARKAERKGEVYTGGATLQMPDTMEAQVAEEPGKVIVDRKYYTGTFDNEISVQLYIRGLKGDCGQPICLWEAVFKFGDQEFIPMTVTRTTDSWIFAEDPGPGAMELSLKGDTFTGTWTSSADNTGYEVKLTETAPSNKKLRVLEEVFAVMGGE